MRRSSSVAGGPEVRRPDLPAVAVAQMDTLRDPDHAADRLQPRDRARFIAIASSKRRRELLAGRSLLRALAAHLDLASVEFDGAEGGAGVVVCGRPASAPELSASVTHAGPWVACALGHGDGVGIDIEALAERDVAALADFAFVNDAASIRKLPTPERKLEFYRRWTRYEAAVKRGGQAGRAATWMLPGQWVLSLDWTSGALSVEPQFMDDRGGLAPCRLESLS